MRAILLATAMLALALPGCITAPGAGDDPVPAADADPETLTPVTAEWKGRILVSPLAIVAHNRDTETRFASIQREGLVFEVTETPADMQVALEVTSGVPTGEYLIMVSSPHVEGKGREYFNSWSRETSQCIRIPAEGLEPGLWQVMIHSRNAANVDFTFLITTLGGAGAILEGHAHSAAEAAETEELDALPCDG